MPNKKNEKEKPAPMVNPGDYYCLPDVQIIKTVPNQIVVTISMANMPGITSTVLLSPLAESVSGMICLDGNGAFSHVSLRNKPDVYNSPFLFAALSLKGIKNGAKILEGPVQSWKIFGNPAHRQWLQCIRMSPL